ncbi:hypothetical protein BDW22DRAFT_1344657 [Trametopsis cervina]|nr:hypothetical protein BDW22DRAFT_1344657 [Trametopsis cervina]
MSACSSVITTEMMDLDQQLAQLLGTMTLQGVWNAKADVVRDAPNTGYAPGPTPAAAVHDEDMSDSSDAEDSSLYQARCPSPLFFTTPLLTFDDLPLPSCRCEPNSKRKPRSRSKAKLPPSSASALVKLSVAQQRRKRATVAIQEQLSSGLYPTTGGAYLELIFIHREILYACPQLHRDCAMGFCDLAQFLEHRDWRADREGDAEAVAAFRHEAGLVAHVASAW